MKKSLKNIAGQSLAAMCLLASGMGTAHASIAYGTINNFDTVNDTGTNCHGFEIEIEDIHSPDITYCYSYNHYGTPRITEDNSDPLHPRVRVRYESARNTNGTWAAYTAVPSGPIAPTLGHQFTNPSLNFGGEHFGVGYRGTPTNIIYHWLVDDGAGVLVQGGAVIVSTPTFTYYAPAAGAPAQVQAVIAPVPEEPVLEFGTPSWVKEIVTSSHTNREIRLRDLVSKDPDYPNDKDWRNGEPDEVEAEWELLQTEFNPGHGGGGGGGVKGKLAGAPEDLDNGDEIITRRYEFYKYVGPIDPGTGEALADKVGPDGIHGTLAYTNTVVVGDYLGAQMSAFDKELQIGLIDHVADGEINEPYATRTVVIAGVPFTATITGALPNGMTFDVVSGALSGTPTESGIFTFNVRVTATNNPVLTKSYTFAITAAGVELPPHSTVDTASSPVDSGNTTGTGLYTNGMTATVTATPAAGFKFAKWTDNGATVSSAATYQFTNTLNRSLVANFVALPPRLSVSKPQANTLVLTWPTNDTGFVLQQNSSALTTNWVDATNAVTVDGVNNQATISTLSGSRFFRLKSP